MSASACPRETLSRRQRLRSSGEFLRLKEQGRRQVYGCLIINWQASQPIRSSNAPGTRLGVVTSRRIGIAVIRNRARRLLREVFRRHRHRLQFSMTVVLVARPSIAEMDYAGVERDFLEALRRARLIDTVSSDLTAATEFGTPSVSPGTNSPKPSPHRSL